MKKTLVVILLAFIWRLFFFFPGIVLEGIVNKNLTGTGISLFCSCLFKPFHAFTITIV